MSKFTYEEHERIREGRMKRDQWLIPKSPNLPTIYTSEKTAYRFLFHQRWPDGPKCIYCGNGDRLYTHVISSVIHCGHCAIHFSLRMGRIYERSKLPLNKWLYGIFLVKSGIINAKEISTRLNIRLKSAVSLKDKILRLNPDEFGVIQDKAAAEAAIAKVAKRTAKRAEATKEYKRNYYAEHYGKDPVKAAEAAKRSKAKKEYQRKYQLKNSERIKARKKKTREDNKEEINAKERVYRRGVYAAKANAAADAQAAAKAAAEKAAAAAAANDAIRRDRAAAKAAAALAAHTAAKPNENELCSECLLEFPAKGLKRIGDDWLCADCRLT